MHRSLLERALDVVLRYEHPGLPRAVSFEYLNRQLIWHELSELLLVLLPLFSPEQIARFLRRYLPRPKLPAAPTADGAPGIQLNGSMCCTWAGPDVGARNAIIQPCTGLAYGKAQLAVWGARTINHSELVLAWLVLMHMVEEVGLFITAYDLMEFCFLAEKP